MSVGENSIRVVVIALLANLGIATAKFVGAFFTQSASLLAEAIHSLVDCTNQVFLLIGSKKAAKPPSETHPLGYGREAFFWSFMVAILLFSMGGLFAIYEGIHKISDQGEVSSPVASLLILSVSLILEGYSFNACLHEVRKQNPYNTLWKWFRKTTSSELLVIFTEDAAAMLGLSVATFCVLMAWLTGNAKWDAIGSISVGFVLVVVAALLAIEVKSLIIGEASTADFKKFIEEQMAEFIPQGRVLRLIALQIGSNEVMLSYKVSTGTIQDTKTLISAINSIEKKVKERFSQVRWQFVEPDDLA